MKTWFILFLLTFVTGCANTDYALYADTQVKVESARYAADIAKYKAMSDIAVTGDSSAKVAALIAIAIGQSPQSQQNRLQAPQQGTALQWATVLVPSLTQVAGMRYSYLSQQSQSDNAFKTSESTNNTFLGIAGKIQTPAGNTTNTTNTTSTTTADSHYQELSGTGTLGSGAYSASDSHAVESPVFPVTQVISNP